MLRLLLTGGGTAGHVIPQIALIQHIQDVNPDASLCYVGSKYGIEKKLIKPLNMPYYAILTGKWRRYLSWRNLLTPFQVIIGIIQSIWICLCFKPTIVLSKGGFVALPVVIGAWLLRIPIIVHESDVIPGLANRLSFPLARLICYTFQTPSKTRYQKKTVLTGLPIRSELSKGDKQKGLEMLGFDTKKPILFIWGGSLGAASINHSIYRLLPRLTRLFQVVHLAGPNKLSPNINHPIGYRVFEYLDVHHLSHILACADIVISRAGATSIYELLLLHKPHILCPLSTKISRGEQIYNARFLEKLGLSVVIDPNTFSDDVLFKVIQKYYQKLPQWKERIAIFNLQSGTQRVYEQILKVQHKDK